MNTKHVPLETVWTNPIHFLAFGCGLGLSPLMPGTVGTLLGVALFFLLPMNPYAYGLVVAAFFVVGIFLCGITARDLKCHDHPGIVCDEVVGILITYTLIKPTWFWLLAGFIAFRFFDIVKPWPIKMIDRHVKGGLGIMLDDVLAGGFAWGVLYALKVWLSR